ncbi:MAG: hypothetical protein EXR49_08450 [Dehalococcoidia bacterium]|nr:hypothetical protein [Dehalococcoidia bacterium]
MKPLTSVAHDVDDLDAALELFHERGWTDGLPIVPPTEEKVARFLHAAGREPDEVLGRYATRKRTVTAEKVAINAVMAGCRAEHFPVVVAIVEGMCQERFGLHGANASTGGMAIGFVVNGPIRNALAMNYRGNVFGPGNRANASIGRAIRLVQQNVMGSVSGAGNSPKGGRDILDRSTMGQPGKYACYHLPENEEDFPTMTPLHVERGFRREENVVTVFPTAGHVQVSLHADGTAAAMVDTLVQYMTGAGRLGGRYALVVLPPECIEIFVRDGWTKADIRKAIFEKGARSVAWAKRNGWPATGGPIDRRGGAVLPGDEERIITFAPKPEDLYIAIAGGPAGAFAYLIMPYGGLPVSQRIRVTA